MTEEDKLYGPDAPYSSIIASDGSVKPDGSMGAAAVRLPSNAEDNNLGIAQPPLQIQA